jgi:hypothetical protein
VVVVLVVVPVGTVVVVVVPPLGMTVIVVVAVTVLPAPFETVSV